MKNFLRVLQVALRRRVTFAAALACSIGVAFLWGGNLTLIKPMIEVVFSDKKPHDQADEKVKEAQERLLATSAELAAVEAELKQAPAAKKGELEVKKHRLEGRQAIQQRAVQFATFLQPLVHRHLPNSAFASLALYLGLFVVATLIKDAMLVGNLVLVERMTQLAVFDMRNQMYRKTLDMEMA